MLKYTEKKTTAVVESATLDDSSGHILYFYWHTFKNNIYTLLRVFRSSSNKVSDKECKNRTEKNS